jgi:hypothetical protein
MKLRENQSKKKDTIKRSKSTWVNSQSHDPNHETKIASYKINRNK